jgi:hypothetical protein
MGGKTNATNNAAVIGLLGAVLLLSAFDWMEEGIQLKQYTFDVMLALIPFVLSDKFFREVFVEGKRQYRVVFLAIPCALSYIYPIALLARLLGWYLYQRKLDKQTLHKPAVIILGLTMLLALAGIWLTDHRFNLKDQAVYLSYWHNCILRIRLQEEGIGGLKLLANFFWGWHQGRLMPLVVAVIAPLQVLGIYAVVKRWRGVNSTDENLEWGSRTVGSLILLFGVVLASLLVNYPICSGRLVLFTQLHLQILAIEGAIFLFSVWHTKKVAMLFLYAGVWIVALFSVHRYITFVRDESPENLRPMVSLLKPEISDTIWVHPCSVFQVQTWPDPLPVQNVLLSKRKEFPERGQKVWVVWTHLGDEYCREYLEKLRSQALTWQVINEGRGRGLVLAEF